LQIANCQLRIQVNNQQSTINNQQSSFSIVTPSFNQLDWLRLCVASVRDQVPACGGIDNSQLQILNSNQQPTCSGSREAGTTGLSISNQQFLPKQQSAINNQQSPPTLRVEHIIQDAGTPGIEDFAREIGAEFYRDGVLVVASTEAGRLEIGDRVPSSPRSGSLSSISHLPSPYRVTIYCESDSGMYDAINRGLRRASGGICAWLNCDEQYLPGTLPAVADWFAGHPEAEVLAGDTILLDPELRPRAYRKAVPPNRRYIQAYQMNLHSSSLFFRRSILERGHWLGSRFRSIGDSEWVAFLLDDGVQIHCLAQPLSTFVLGPDNLSVSAISKAEAAQWRGEMALRSMEKVFLRVENIFRRAAAGAYLPRRAGASIYIPGELKGRTEKTARWLDFRFKI
jgi:glycosyltransferase involved in cell wall biosynthesis